MKIKYQTSELFRALVLIGLFLFAFVIGGGNTNNPDYFEYEYRYTNLVNASHTSSLLYLFQVIFHKIGVSYQLFRAIEVFIGLFLLTKTIRRYSEKWVFVFALYLVYPFLLDVVQLGNFVAYTIALFSLKYLEEEWPKGGIKYAIAILIASQFHILAIIYMIFLLVYVKNTKHLMLIAIGITAFLTATISLLPQFINHIPFISSHAAQIQYYITFNESYRGGAFVYGILIIVCFFVCYYKESLTKRYYQPGEDLVISGTMIRILALVLCFVPFIIINSEFVRIIRNTWVLYYISLTYDIKKVNRKMYTLDKLFKLTAILLAVFLFYKELSPSAFYYESVTQAIFDNNLFW
ncbi:EpsG family protein [Lachnospiraceae bacterium C10]|nr:EpsG family protein [Lachnospiraceae bacterium C10]